MQICCKDKVKCVTGKMAVEVAYIKVISHPELPSKHCLILPQASHISEFLSVFLHPMNIEKSRNKSCLAAHLFPHDMEVGSDFNEDFYTDICCLCQRKRRSRCSGIKFGVELFFFAKD